MFMIEQQLMVVKVPSMGSSNSVVVSEDFFDEAEIALEVEEVEEAMLADEQNMNEEISQLDWYDNWERNSLFNPFNLSRVIVLMLGLLFLFYGRLAVVV